MAVSSIGYFSTWRVVTSTVVCTQLIFLLLLFYLILLFIRFVLPESPRWLLALGRKQEVLSILQKASKFNGRPLPSGTDKRLMPTSINDQQENSSDAGILDLFRTKRMRNNTFCLFIIWFSVYLVYYGLVLNMGNIGGDLYINSVNTDSCIFFVYALIIIFW